MLSVKNLAQEQALSIIKVLINDSSEDTKTTLNAVFKNLIEINSHLEVVKILIQDKRVDPGADDNYAIRHASKYGYLEIVKILIQDERVDPSADDNRAIKWASQYGHLEIVKILIQDERVDPSADNNYAIKYASRNGYLETVKVLIPKIDLGKITDNKILNLAKEINGKDNEKTIFERLNTEIDELKRKNETLANMLLTEKSQTTEKKSKEDASKKIIIIKTMDEYNIHKICIDRSNITLEFALSSDIIFLLQKKNIFIFCNKFCGH